jgi:hypothetical protein
MPWLAEPLRFDRRGQCHYLSPATTLPTTKVKVQKLKAKAKNLGGGRHAYPDFCLLPIVFEF